jgi:chemotaxis protein histidine kinase CheA
MTCLLRKKCFLLVAALLFVGIAKINAQVIVLDADGRYYVQYSDGYKRLAEPFEISNMKTKDSLDAIAAEQAKPGKGKKSKNGEKVKEPKTEKVKEPKTEKVKEPKPEKVKEPKPAKVKEPKPEKVKEPKAEKVKAPKAEKVKAPKAEKVKAPKAEKVKEPKAEKVKAPKPKKTEKTGNMPVDNRPVLETDQPATDTVAGTPMPQLAEVKDSPLITTVTVQQNPWEIPNPERFSTKKNSKKAAKTLLHPTQRDVCNVAYERVNEMTQEKERGLSSETLFEATPDSYVEFMKGEPYLVGNAHLFKKGRKTYLSVKLIVDGPTGRAEYGSLEAGAACVFVMLNQEAVQLFIDKTDKGTVVNKQTLYNVTFQVDKKTAKYLKRSPLDYVEWRWTQGKQKYNVLNIDFFTRQFECLKQVK